MTKADIERVIKSFTSVAKKDIKKDKNIMIQYYNVNGMLILNIQDEGQGFDTNILKDLFVKDNETMFHGRGIKISSSDFDFVVYNDVGNSVLFGKKLTKS